MPKYLITRLLSSIPALVGATILIFLAMRVMPGDPLATITSETAGTHVLTEQELEAVRASLGLDKPLYMQYLSWMADVARGDFGRSFWRQDPISATIFRRFPITAQIALMAIIISWLVGIPIGLISALKRNSWLDNISRSLVLVFVAVPSFWIGMLFITFTVLVLNWKPPMTITYFWDDPLRNLQMTFWPAATMGIGLGAGIARMARSATLEVMHTNYIRTARAKGLRQSVIVFRHMLRNALLPVITLSGMSFGGLLGGSVAVERVFAVPGLGQSMLLALGERDWMMIQNMVLLYAVIFSVMNLLVDLSYGILDPRIRTE